MNKKSLIFLLFFFFVVSNCVFSLEFGIKGGFSLSKLNIIYCCCCDGDCEDEKADSRNLNGFQAGMFFTFDISENIQLQPEILFAKRGTKEVDSSTSEWYTCESEAKWKLTYVEIPVLLKFNLQSKGSFKPGFFVGPYFAHNLSSKVCVKTTGQFDDEIYDREYEEDIECYLESFDYGIIVGAGFDFKTGSTRIILDVRYSHGLANIFKSSAIVNNRSFMFMIGIGL